MEKCIFCEIAGRRMPSNIIYEDNDFIALLDVNPLNVGHTLVVPKAHVRWTYEIEKFGDYWEVAKAIALAAIEALQAKFVNFITAGLGVAHAHIHVVPRFENDGHPEVPVWRNIKKIPKEEMIQIAAKLSAAVAKNPPKKALVAMAPRVEKAEEVEEKKPVETRSEDDIKYIRREIESG